MKLRVPAHWIDVTDQGGGMTLIGCDNMLAAMQRQQLLRRRAAWHEAGHCVAAQVYAAPIENVTIEGRAHMTRGDYYPPPGLGTEAMCVICLSGPAAEALLGTFDDEAGRGDYAQARDILSRTHGPLEIGFLLSRYRASADRLIQSERRRVERIATELLRLGSLTGEQIAALVG